MHCPECDTITESTRVKSKKISMYGNVVEMEYDSYHCGACDIIYFKEYDMKISTFKDYFNEASG